MRDFAGRRKVLFAAMQIYGPENDIINEMSGAVAMRCHGVPEDG